MAYIEKSDINEEKSNVDESVDKIDEQVNKKRIYQRKWFKISAIVLVILLIVGSVLVWKADSLLKKVFKGDFITNIAHSLPGVNNQLKGEKEGRINILLIGMRGINDPAGGTLADTIMVVSVKPEENKVALISLPRDLFVNNPAVGYKTKINAVYAYGEKKGEGQGIKYMKQEVSAVTGLPIQYSAVINFDAFKQLIDAVGGVEITLDKPFEESVQFDQPHICNSFFNVPTGKTKEQTVRYFSKERQAYRTRVIKSYPLCTAPKDTLECGGDFKLPAGTQTLDSEKALCYARSRETSNDFKRAKRQQQIIQALKTKLLKMGTLTNLNKLNKIFDSLGDNIKTDIQAWEMKRFYDLYNKMKNYQLYQRVVNSSDDPQSGLVYGQRDPTFGSILLLKGDNFDRIHNLFQNIFTFSPQEKKIDTTNVNSKTDSKTSSKSDANKKALTQ